MSTPEAVRIRTSSGWQDMALVGPQGPPGGSMNLIQDILLGASAANFDFTNIPQTFQALQLFLNLRADPAAPSVAISCQFSGITAASYYSERFNIAGNALAATGSAETLAATSLDLGACPGSTAPSNAFSSHVFTIPSYASASGKGLVGQSILRNTTATGGLIQQLISGHFYSASQINRILLYPSVGNFVAGSRASLYGIGSASFTSGQLVGSPQAWLLSAIPNGYREFDGSAIVLATHPILYGLFGGTIPDLRGLTMVGQGGTLGAAVGATGGEVNHTLTAAEMPSHSHGLFTNNSSQLFNLGSAYGSLLATGTNTGQTSLSGSGGAHNNMQPYRAVRWITVAG